MSVISQKLNVLLWYYGSGVFKERWQNHNESIRRNKCKEWKVITVEKY